MGQSATKTLMDLLDSSITLEMVIKQERKFRDTLRVASKLVKEKDPISASCVVWLTENGYIPEYRDHIYHEGELVLPNWNMECFYCQTYHWEQFGLEGYQSQHRYCSLRGGDIQNDPTAWGATHKLMLLKNKTLHQIIDLVFKIAGEQFDMSSFLSRDAGPWEKLIRVQDLFMAIQRRFVAARDSLEWVLETSRKSIPESIERLRIHEKIFRNYMDLYERATFSTKGSYEDKFLGDWLKFMMKTGFEQKFPNTATASNAIESARILMRSESRQGGVKLVQVVVWDQIRSAYFSTGGAGSENVSETLKSQSIE
jgi:hypothetical protein